VPALAATRVFEELGIAWLACPLFGSSSHRSLASMWGIASVVAHVGLGPLQWSVRRKELASGAERPPPCARLRPQRAVRGEHR
jgi:hypothetical protein